MCMMNTEGEKRSKSSFKSVNQQVATQAVIQKHGAQFQNNQLKDVQVVFLEGVEVGQRGQGLLFFLTNFVDL